MHLNQETNAYLERVIGKTVKEMSQMDIKEEIAYIESKTQKKVVYSTKVDHRMKGRGSPPIAKRRLFTMDDVDRTLKGVR